MSVNEAMGNTSTVIFPRLCTGTILDIGLGHIETGVNGEHLLNPSMTPLFGASGKSGCYKSTFMDSLMTSILVRYPGSEATKLDTENNFFNTDRFNVMSEQFTEDGSMMPISNRIVLKQTTEMSLEEWDDYIDRIVKYRLANKKDFLVETPFKDIDGKPIKTWIPYFCDTDSFSMLRSKEEAISLEKKDISDSSQNMLDMRDGNLKNKLFGKMMRNAQSAGITFLFTAQIGKNQSLNPMKPASKQIQWMKQDDRIKRVGSLFEYLVNTLVQFSSPAPLLLDSDRTKPEYASGIKNATDLNLVNTTVLRTKTGGSGGLNFPFVISQDRGIMNNLTNYHFLKNSDNFGFEISGVRKNRTTKLLPESVLHRSNIIDTLSSNYELGRALEIMVQLRWISLFWNLDRFPVDVPKSAEAFYDLLESNKSIKKSDILNSRGYWTYDKNNKRPYMSIADILTLVNKK